MPEGPSSSELRLTELRRFPVKSCRGQELETAVVEPWGLAGDRRWMLVDESGETVTVREHREMLLIHPRLRADGGLEVSAPDHDDLVVHRPAPGGRLVDVTVFGRAPFGASPAGHDADAWFSKVMAEPVRLVFADDPNRRQANPAYAGPGVPMHFGDGYPLLVTTEASLAALNDLIAAGEKADEGPLPMVRFRPNLVVGGGIPWAEDGWLRLRVGEAEFRVVKGCDRCAIPTTDEVTAVRRKEPTYTLAKHRRWDGAVWFGMNVVPLTPGATLRVGDEVEVLDSRPAPDGPPR